MKVLFVAALAEEVAALADHVPVLELGVGKVQAATTLAARLSRDPIDLVVNIGTAGGLTSQSIGEIVTDADERARLAAHADLVDMEGYAVAATAIAFDRQVWLVKAVSDGADAGTVGSWADALVLCSERLAAWADGRGLLDTAR